MKKLVAAIAAFVVVAMVGCGGGSSKTVDPVKTADAMREAFAPEGELLVVEDSVLDNFYSVDSALVTGHKIYVSTSFVAEEIAVFGCAAGKEADVKKMVEQRLQDLKDSFDGYLPDELASLTANAKIVTGGGAVCLIAGSAENVAAAEKIFNDAAK